MSNPPLEKVSVHKARYSPQYILTGWLQATVRFHQCYTQLITCVNQHVAEQDWRTGHTPDASQLYMMIRMKRELETLAQDLDQSSTTKRSAWKDYEQLATHTQRLNQLSDQVQCQLKIGNYSAL